jgi:hypothetical protein
MIDLGQALLGALFVVVGVLSIVGVRKRWGWLVDPPDELWPLYSQSFIKRFFGKAALEGYTMFTGVVFVAAGAIFVVIAIWRALGN